MIEMHQLTRYEHAPVVIFDPAFDAVADAKAFADWLVDFCQRRTRPPKLLLFTFRATDRNQEDVCQFMKAVAGHKEAADILAEVQIQLDFGEMSPEAAASVHDRILTKQF